MHIELEGLRISLPDSSQNSAPCIFTDDKKHESLTVSRDKVPAANWNAADIMSQTRKEFQSGFGESMKVLNQQPLVLLGQPGQQMKFKFEEFGAVEYGWVAVALMSSVRFVQITYMTRDEGDGQAKFEHMLNSVSDPNLNFIAKMKGGWVHRYAGPIALDVPINMDPPHVYSFFLSDDPGTNIVVKLYRLGQSAEPFPTLQQETARDSRDGAAIDNQEFGAFSAAGGNGTFTKYVSSRRDAAGNEREFVQQLQIAFPDGLTAIVSGRTPQASRGQLENTLNQLMRTLERSDR